MGPIDYSMDVLNPIEGYMQGLKFGEGILTDRLNRDATTQNMGIQREQMDLAQAQFAAQEQARAQQAAAAQAQAEQQRAQAQAGQEAALALYDAAESGTLTTAQIEKFKLTFPAYAEAATEAMASFSDERTANEAGFGQQLVYAIQNDNTEQAAALLKERQQAAEAAGDAQGAAVYKAQLIELEQDPNGLKTQTILGLSQLMPPDELDQYLGIIGMGGGQDAPAGFRELELRAEAGGLVRGTPEYRQFMLENGGKGALVEVNTGDAVDNRPITSAPAKDYQRIWDEEAGTFRDVVIPGSETAIAMEKDAQGLGRKEGQQQLMLGTTITSLGLNIAEIENGGLPVAGRFGDFRRTGFGRALTGDSAVDFGNRTAQVTDSAALQEIQRMRDNSPTGGAVGNLTDGERVAIGNAVTALNNSTSSTEYVRAAKAYRQLALEIAYKGQDWELSDDGLSVVINSPSGENPPQAEGTAGSNVQWRVVD